ncbi:PIN-like domain-containing protein [Nocardiopsis metallicus]|uniref:VapC45 PIN like domain-containing protein n=1 Tax=Nocardiopsis metallicus TaxID=179819 RepID=A0A840WAV1_9ACTN|nr:hypothetical protein [Nocardiopsis metallicus]MBB5494170.1 hypothetical protein [Nocardiopsis metallicus]
MDENVAGRTTRRCLSDLGYVVHTPADLYGSRELAEGVRDEDWLAKLTAHDWAVISKDEHILQRPTELAAYKAARIHMFMLPNNVRRDDLIALLHQNLRDICTRAVEKTPGVWRVTRQGLTQL